MTDGSPDWQPLVSVGGTVELRDVGEVQANRTDAAPDSFVQPYAALAGSLAAALLALAGAWYARRRWGSS